MLLDGGEHTGGCGVGLLEQDKVGHFLVEVDAAERIGFVLKAVHQRNALQGGVVGVGLRLGPRIVGDDVGGVLAEGDAYRVEPAGRVEGGSGGEYVGQRADTGVVALAERVSGRIRR